MANPAPTRRVSVPWGMPERPRPPPEPPGMGGASVAPVRWFCAFLRASLIRLIAARRSVGEVAHVLNGAADVPVVHLVGTANESGQNGFVAKIVDDTRNAVAPAMNG